VVRCVAPEVPTAPAGLLVFGAWIPTTYLYSYPQGSTTIPAHQSNADCILTQDPSYATGGMANFRGLTLLSTYTSEIDLRVSATVQELDVRSGRIKQNDQATVGSGDAGTISVAQTLTWTGGTINSNTVTGKLDLKPHASGLIAPTDEGTVNLGSTLTLLGDAINLFGSALTIDNGTVNLNRGKGFVVQKGSKINFAPVPKTTLGYSIKIDGKPDNPDDEGYLKIEDGGEGEIKAKNRPANNPTGKAVVEFKGKTPVLVNLGRLELVDRVDLQFLPDGDGQGQGLQQNDDDTTAFVPVLDIEAGCFITCTKKTRVVITGGTVALTERRAAGVAEANQPSITITAGAEANGALVIAKDATLKRSDVTPQRRITLDITGADLSLRCAGTLDLYAMKSEDKNDKIVASGKVEFTDDTKVKLTWFESDTGGLRGVNSTWELVKAGYPGPGDAINQTPADANFTRPTLVGTEALVLERAEDGSTAGDNILLVRRTQ
jgi:hypothetical protein